MICSNLDINSEGVLTFAGRNTLELAKKYKTPLYLMDEERIRQNARVYVSSMKKYFGEDSLPLFASKAASFKQIYRIVNEEGMGVDVVSAGEFYTALAAGFPAEKVFFHGNNKTDDEIEYAIENKMGYFVADSIEEICAIDKFAAKKGVIQKILLRIMYFPFVIIYYHIMCDISVIISHYYNNYFIFLKTIFQNIRQ